MKNTMATFSELVQTDSNDHEAAGMELAMAMARDRMSYTDSYEKLCFLKHAMECAEKHLSKAAFKELSKENRVINAAMLAED